MHVSVIDEIKDRLDIAEVISQYVKLQKAGANYKAPCPFHSEKTGSFFVSPAKQIWHCFGCQKGGDIFGFIKEIEGVEFGDALRILAQRAGVELKKQTPEAVQLKTERQRFYEICDLATKFFIRQLEASKMGSEAKKYLLKRGLSEQSIQEWKIGYAPDSWHGLSIFLNSSGYKNAEIEKTGLAIRTEVGTTHDRFRSRIIFPIFDLNFQPIGFGGRIFYSKKQQDGAKYINSPNTILYDKSRVLYGLDKAKIEIKKKNACILVEGYTDVIMSFEAGVKNVVSSSGTALTGYQLKILKRYTDNLILGYDMDVAGDTANKRGIDLALAQGFNVRVVRPPYEGKDPADIIAKDPNKWISALEQTKSIMEYYFDNAFANHDPKTPEGKKAISKILLPSIKRLDNQIEISFWIQKLAYGLEAREDDLREEMKKIKKQNDSYVAASESVPIISQKTRRELLEERILVLILKHAKYVELVQENLLPFFSPKAKEIVNILGKSTANLNEGFSPEAKNYYDYLCLKSDIETIEEKEAFEEFNFHAAEIEKILLKSQLEMMAKGIKKAESEKDAASTEKLKEEYNALANSINNLGKERKS